MRRFGFIVLLASLCLPACQGVAAPAAQPPPAIRVEPQAGQNLYSISRVVLEDVTVSHGVLDRPYPGYAVGTPCIVAGGTVRNMDPGSNGVTMFAYGYNSAGERVAETIDADDIPGQLFTDLAYGNSGAFTMHLNAADDLESVRIFAFTSPEAPS